MKFVPINEGILVRKVTPETTEGGILLVEHNSQELEHGLIIRLGEGALSAQGQRVKPSVQEGDTVMFRGRGSTRVKSDGEELLLITERNILGKLTT